MPNMKTAELIARENDNEPIALIDDPRDESKEIVVKGEGLTGRAKMLKELMGALKGEMSKSISDRETRLCEAIDKQIDEIREEMVTAINKSQDNERLDGAPKMGTGKGEWSLFRALSGIATKNWRGAELEKEVLDSMRDQREEKAMVLGVDSSGGYIVPSNYQAEIIEKLDQENPLLDLGARIIPGVNGSPFILPKQTSRATASYVGEGATIGKTQPGLGQLEFIPRTLAARTQLSNTLRMNATPAVEEFVTSDLRIQFDNALTLFGLLGDGSNHQPIGVINEPGVGTEAFPGSQVMTYNDLTNMLHELMEENALRGSLGFCVSPDFLLAFWQMLDVTDQPLNRRLMAELPPTTIIGYPMRSTTALPTTGTSAVFGDWSQLIIPTWADMQISATIEGADTWEKNLMDVRALLTHDIGVRHAESFCVATGF